MLHRLPLAGAAAQTTGDAPRAAVPAAGDAAASAGAAVWGGFDVAKHGGRKAMGHLYIQLWDLYGIY